MSKQDCIKRYYWRHHKDFFNRYDIKLMESQPRFGHDAVILYHKLLDEACVHSGELRYSEKIPYTKDDLKFITGNYKTFNQAFTYMLEKGLIEQWDDGTFYMEYAHKQSGDENGRTKRTREAIAEQNKHNNGAKNAPEDGEKDTITTTTTKTTDKDINITTTTEECGGKFTDIKKALTADDVIKISRTFDLVDDLIDVVANEVKAKQRIVDRPFEYVVGYAENKGWYRRS